MDIPEIIPGEPDLSLAERCKLVQIAHETSDMDVKRWALNTLERASVPAIVLAEPGGEALEAGRVCGKTLDRGGTPTPSNSAVSDSS